MSNTEATVYIVDDNAAARRSMELLVSMKGMHAVVFESAEDFLELEKHEPYSCLIADLRLTGMSGLDLQQVMLDQGIDLPVIIVTGHGEVPAAVLAMQNGAVVFLEKPCEPEELASHIEKALQERVSQLNARHVKALLKNRATKLTDSELDVLRQMVAGKANKVIANELDMGLRTVELRRSEVLKKMQADSVAELVRMAIILGLDNDRKLA